MPLPPLPVVLPLLMAAVLVAIGHYVRRGIIEALAIITAAGVMVVCAILIVQSSHGLVVYWFGNWAPRDHIALGISFVIDPFGAGMAMLCSLLVLAAFCFSLRYFETVGSLFHVLILVFLGAMCGFSLTGDAFNLFVFFELMSTAAFALCGYKTEERAPIQGALNFAVTNTIGAFMVLTGIALLYGATGALNLAQIGQAIGSRVDGLVIVAFSFISVGFLVKAAAVPFHFWLADAHAVAPTPVCVLFSGIMVEMALYAVARIYWVVFGGAFSSHTAALRGVLVGLGILTCLVGGTMCYVQTHVKRMLAFSTVSHVGVMILGFGLLTPLALTGMAMDVMGHAMVKSALFFGSGIVLHRLGEVDEIKLRSRGWQLKGTAAVFVLGGLALAGLPPFGIFAGDSLIELSAHSLGLTWLRWVILAAAVLTGAAVVRFAGRVFWGWGYYEKEAVKGAKVNEGQETEKSHYRIPLVMIGPPAILLILGVAVGLSGRLLRAVEASANVFQNRDAYIATVLSGIHAGGLQMPVAPPHIFTNEFEGLFAAALVFLLVIMALFRSRLFKRTVPGGRFVLIAVGYLQKYHSGYVGDYVTWLVIGVSVFGGFLIILLR